jgi:rod shape-determining protein MreC
MSKFLFFFFLVIILLAYLFKLDKIVVNNFSLSNILKEFYIEKFLQVSGTTEKYFNNVSTIDRLQKENEELKQYKILYQTTQKRLDTIRKFISKMEMNIINAHNVKLAKVLSYISFHDFTKVWLDIEKEDDTILGLITEDYAAGIVVNQNNKAVALLNGNKQCSYAIFIGENKIPGIITSAKNKKHLLAKYIPNWVDINKGDEVITSGMDNIFFEGLKVGKILSVEKKPTMQIATIMPYANVLEKKYFYAYKHDAGEALKNKQLPNK